MDEYKVVTYEKEYHACTYYVEATSAEEAESLVRAGGMDYAKRNWIGGKIESVEAELSLRGKEVRTDGTVLDCGKLRSA